MMNEDDTVYAYRSLVKSLGIPYSKLEAISAPRELNFQNVAEA